MGLCWCMDVYGFVLFKVAPGGFMMSFFHFLMDFDWFSHVLFGYMKMCHVLHLHFLSLQFSLRGWAGWHCQLRFGHLFVVVDMCDKRLIMRPTTRKHVFCASMFLKVARFICFGIKLSCCMKQLSL